MKFRNEYFFLSNMYPAPITVGAYTFTCVEAAYQASKCFDRASEFTQLNGFAAKKLGRSVEMAPGFEAEKDKIMSYLVGLKFKQHPELQEKLLAVTEPIIEDNDWGDTYWGMCNGKGLNKLGNILMDLRDFLSAKYYTGIGSRKTPEDVLALMKAVAQKLSSEGYILRTGNAQGADAAFASGSTKTEMYYPEDVNRLPQEVLSRLVEDACKVHPKGKDLLTYPYRNYLLRDGLQVLGCNYDILQKSKFVLCWTPMGEKIGGTAQAIKIAEMYNIPVFNLAKQDVFNRLFKYVNS